jgi:Phospholipase_D-nuclease N-terminal
MQAMAAKGFPGLAEPWASVLIGVLAIAVIVWISVLVRVLRGVLRSRLDTGMKVVWVVFIMSSQPLGVILWFLIGRDHAYRATA